MSNPVPEYQVIRGIKVGPKLDGVAAKDRIICLGRAPDGAGRPCRARYHDGCMCCDGWCSAVPGGCPAPHVLAHIISELIPGARAAGWRIGPVQPDGSYQAMCPRCSAPDPALVRMCAALAASTQRAGQLSLIPEAG
jgi:hypothetical protein